MTEALRVVIAAEGGFGAQTAAAVLAEAAYESDKEALYIPNFGVEQRGGVSVAFLQIGDAVPACPKFDSADLAVALNRRAVSRLARYVGAHTTFIYDEALAAEAAPFRAAGARLIAVPALDYARRECGGRGGNLVMAGLIVALTEIVPVEAVRSVLKRRYGSGAMADANLKALRFGLGYDGGDIE